MNTTLFTTIGIAICLMLGLALITVGNVFLISLIISAIKLIKTTKIINVFLRRTYLNKSNEALEEAIKILYEFGAKKEYTIGMCENLIEKRKKL